MVIGGALGAVSRSDPKPVPDINIEIMNPMIGDQARPNSRPRAETFASKSSTMTPTWKKLSRSIIILDARRSVSNPGPELAPHRGFSLEVAAVTVHRLAGLAGSARAGGEAFGISV